MQSMYLVQSTNLSALKRDTSLPTCISYYKTMGVAGLTTFLREGRTSLSVVNQVAGVINDSLTHGELEGRYTEPPQGEWTPVVIDAWS